MGIVRFSFLFLIFSTSSLVSQEKSPQQAPEQAVVQEKLLTKNQLMTAQGQKISYEVHGGAVTVKSKDKKDSADMYFFAYFVKPSQENEHRPIAFCFNGGPGSSSVWLHMGFLGPKKCTFLKDTDRASPSYIENPLSLLGVCDLVFIDPVSTGFSKTSAPETEKSFCGVEEDIHLAAEFIQSFLIKYQRWQSPKLLIGESYGTARAVGVTNLLQEEYSVNIDGLILISLVLDFQTLESRPSTDLVNILNLPSYAAIAQHHKMLGAPYSDMSVKDLSEKVSAFAIHDYAPALLEGSQVPEVKKAWAAALLSQYTSLPQEFFLSRNLRLGAQEFRRKLLNNETSIIGRFDGRMTTWKPPSEPAICDSIFESLDPSFYSVSSIFNTTINDYLTKELNWKREEPYILLSDSTIRLWNWNTKNSLPGLGYTSFQQDLRNAFAKNPQLTLFVAAGYYDLATPFFGQKYSLDHLFLPQEMRKNVFFKVYEGGHMMYLDEGPRKELSSDLSRFVQSLHKYTQTN